MTAPIIGPPLPTPGALRLLGRARPGRVRPPLGLASWAGDAVDVAILLPRPPADRSASLDEIAAEIPEPSTLAPGTLVLVLGEVEPPETLLGRWLGGKKVVPRADRCSALLARGYERIGGGVDVATGHDLAWGYVRPGDAGA